MPPKLQTEKSNGKTADSTSGATTTFKSKDEKVALQTKIEETDEMKLKMMKSMEPPEPGDLLYPPELNAHLIEQLKMLTGESNQLRKLQFEKDEEIKQLTKTVADLNGRIRDIISGTGPVISSKSAGIISAKITDLCKQNRHLTAEIESYKTKNALLERKIIHLNTLHEQEKEKTDICICKPDASEENLSAESEIKDLNVKLGQVNKRLIESKKKNIELKNEIIAATKILQQELGNKFTSLKELQNEMSGWKGRAEQIVLLKAKVSELEKQLELKKDEPRNAPSQHLKDMDTKRKREVEQALKEYKIIKDENQELRKKMEAARCRARNVECEIVTLKQKMQTFIGKSDADDQLINEQRNQIKTLELYYQDILKENTLKMNKMLYETNEFKKLHKNSETKIAALALQSTEKDAKIQDLRAQINKYEECSLQSVFFTPMRNAADQEIERLSSLVVTLNDRLAIEREKYDKLDTNFRNLKERKKKQQNTITRLEEELAKVQLSRKSSKLSKLSKEMSDCKPPLPKQEPFSLGITTHKSESTDEYSKLSLETLDKCEMEYRLALTEEKLKILEDKLKMVEDEKQDDYYNFTNMIQNSKQLFNEALAVLQKQKCICDGLTE